MSVALTDTAALMPLGAASTAMALIASVDSSDAEDDDGAVLGVSRTSDDTAAQSAGSPATGGESGRPTERVAASTGGDGAPMSLLLLAALLTMAALYAVVVRGRRPATEAAGSIPPDPPAPPAPTPPADVSDRSSDAFVATSAKKASPGLPPAPWATPDQDSEESGEGNERPDAAEPRRGLLRDWRKRG